MELLILEVLVHLRLVLDFLLELLVRGRLVILVDLDVLLLVVLHLVDLLVEVDLHVLEHLDAVLALLDARVGLVELGLVDAQDLLLEELELAVQLLVALDLLQVPDLLVDLLADREGAGKRDEYPIQLARRDIT